MGAFRKVAAMTLPYRAARAALNMIPGRIGRWRIAVSARPEHRGNLAAVGYDTLCASTIPVCLLAPGSIALFGIAGGTNIDPTVPRQRFLECLCPTNRGRHPHAYTVSPTTLHLLQARASQIGPVPVRISGPVTLATYFGELQSRPGNQYRQGAELLRLFNRTIGGTRPTWPDVLRLFAAVWSPAADGDVASVPDILTRVHAPGADDDGSEHTGADDGIEESEDEWRCDHCGATDDTCGECTECYDGNGEECRECGRSVDRG